MACLLRNIHEKYEGVLQVFGVVHVTVMNVVGMQVFMLVMLFIRVHACMVTIICYC